MKTFFRANGKMILFLLVLSLIGSLTVIPYLSYTVVLPPEVAVPKSAILLSSVVNFMVFSLVSILVGLTFGRRVGLGAPHLSAWLGNAGRAPLSGKSLLGTAVVGAVAILLTVGVDLLFQPHLPALLAGSAGEDIVPFWAGLLTMFQGGINEELWMRFGLMTFVVWLLKTWFARKAAKTPSWMYVVGIVFAAVLFGVGHVSAAPVMFAEVTTVLVVRIIVVNSIAGLFFGALYWKKGLEHAIVAHMIGDIVLHAFLG